MAGHSKWANIQHRKKAQDAKRGKLFTKLIREITIASRLGGGDVNTNPRLRLGVDKALSANMPKDTVDRAIKRGAGALEDVSYEEVRYEGYGPAGVAVMVDCMTDNRNRTVAEIRYAFNKCGGNLGTDGSVAFLFSQTGVLSYPRGSDEERILEAALEAGAEDVQSNEDGSLEVLTSPDDYMPVKQHMLAADLPPEEAEVTMRAAAYTTLEGEDAERNLRLLELLDEQEDVQEVYSNADFPDTVWEQLG